MLKAECIPATRWCRRVTPTLVGLAMLLAVVAGPAQQLAPELFELSLSEIYKQATLAVNGRNYAQAIPYLQELLGRLTNAESESGIKAWEYAAFHIGVAYLETDRADQAQDAFAKYLEQFPQGRFRRLVLLLRAEIHATNEDWPKVIATMELLSKERGLLPQELAAANDLLGEAYFRQELWEPALKPLVHVVEHGTDRDARIRAATWATVCLVRLERFSDLFRFLPHVYRTSARYDIELNMALVEGGDRNYGGGNYPNAIMLYRLVYFKQELLNQLSARIEETQRKKERLLTSGLDVGRMSALRRKYNRMIESFGLQREAIREFPDYDQEVMIRLAQTYLALARNWEALLVFRDVYDRFPEHALGEQGLYSAFGTAMNMGRIDRAVDEGYEYVDAYPGGDFWDEITLTLTQIHVNREEYKDALVLGDRALEVHPEHGMRDEMDYLLGYSHFQLEQFEEALVRFEEVRQQYPGSDFREDVDYWYAMTCLFLQRYATSTVEFQQHLDRYLGGDYYEDASFRLGVSQYGEGDFTGAARSLRQFTGRFPESSLLPEAYCMLGDITASWGELDEALEAYRRGRETASTMVQVNYAVFQSARVYELESRYAEIVELFRSYLDEYGETGNFTEATYWIGTAQMRDGRADAAFNTFFDAIAKYGDVPAHHGIDMIIRDLILEHSDQGGGEDRRRFMQRLYQELERARDGGNRTLELRLITLFAETQEDPGNRKRLMVVLLKPRNVPVSGPVTLVAIGREAIAQHMPDLARAAYRELLDKHARSDLVLEALLGMAEFEIEQGEYAQAAEHLQEVINRYASIPPAGRAQKRLGDVYRIQGKHAEAIDAYNVVLSVKEWRGELWPEALHGIGLSYLEQGDPRKAFAFFQRVYVLYDGFAEWAAAAYLKSGECLLKLGLRADARRTYQEMLQHPILGERPEAEQAREALAALGDAI